MSGLVVRLLGGFVSILLGEGAKKKVYSNAPLWTVSRARYMMHK